MTYSEQRIAAVEKTLGLKSPPPPPKDGAVAETAPPSTDTATTTTGTTPTTTPSTDTAVAASSPDEYFGIIAQNLQEGKGAAARAVAKRFLAEYPKSDRAPEAYYRIAESFQNENDFAGAASAFQVVVDKFADSTWAPWSMLRQGECFEALGKHDEAELFWSETAKKYPKSKAAKEAKAHLAK